MKLEWNHFQDQPELIKDRSLKKKIYKEYLWDFFKLLLTNIVIYPIVFVFYLFTPVKKSEIDTKKFFGISINLNKNPEQILELIEDLSAENLLIRVPLHDIENLSAYIRFAEQYADKNLLINILQDRRHIEDKQLLKQSLEKIFSGFIPFTRRFQLGNAINRKKWAIFSMDEFLHFYKVGYDLKKDKFPNLELLGSSVIDFEYYFSIRTLFNFYQIRFDQFSSLLYVDRRGAPENTQMGLDLIGKLKLMQAMLRLSPKSSNEIVITETNWPITDTQPYAPTSEEDCVSLEDQASFLVRYYLMALSSEAVKNIYWHQLIAPGYGLIDNRGDELIKYPSYYAFKFMIFMLQDTKFIKMSVKDGFYQVSFTKKKEGNEEIDIFWSLSTQKLSNKVNTNNKQLFSLEGEELETMEYSVNGSPVYLVSNY